MKSGFEGINPRRTYDADAGYKKNRMGGNARKIWNKEEKAMLSGANLHNPRYQKPKSQNSPESYTLNTETEPREDIPHRPVAVEVPPVVKKNEAPIQETSIDNSKKNILRNKQGSVEVRKNPDGVEVEYKNKKFIVNRVLATMSSWSFMKSLPGRKFVDTSPFAQPFVIAMHELGATSSLSLLELEQAAQSAQSEDKKLPSRLKFVLHPKYGDPLELQMTQNEVKEFLLQVFPKVQQPNLLNRKKPPLQAPEPVKTGENKISPVPIPESKIPKGDVQKIKSTVPTTSVETDIDLSERVNPYNLPKGTKDRIGVEMHTVQDSEPDTGTPSVEDVPAEVDAVVLKGVPTPQTLGEAMDEIANQPEPEGFVSSEVEPVTDVAEVSQGELEKMAPEKPKVFPAEPVTDVVVEPLPLKNETPEKNPHTEVFSKFELEFGITRKELESIEGFEKLSAPQQKMVYENLVQSTYGRVKEEAASQYAKTAEGKRHEAIAAYGKLAGRTWAGIREVFTKDFNILKTEQNVATNFKKGGMSEHGDIITQLTRSMAMFGPRVHEDETTGELLADLVNLDFDRNNRKAEFDAVRNLNNIAHQFAKIPSAWRESTLGVDAAKADEWKVTQLFKAQFSDERKHQLIYDESSKAFTEAKGVLEETLRKSGKSDKDIATILLGVDDRVQQLQFIQASPEAITELSHITDKNMYYETAKSLVGKSGLGYVALGYVARTAVSGLLGWFAAPMVSSGIAASRSWNKTAAELREHDRNARMGVVDTTDNALNIVSAENLISKTKMLTDRYRVLSRQILEREEAGENVKELQAAMHTTLDRLNERITFIRDKQKLNRVNYGTRNTHIGTQVTLYEVLGEATLIIQNEIQPRSNTLAEQIKNSTGVVEEPVEGEKKLEKRQELANRLNRFMAYKETAIESRRRSYRRQELTTQALKAGGMALAGAFLADYFRAEPATVRAEPESVKSSVPTFESPVVETPISGGAPIVEAPTSVPQELVYEIKRGDTLTKILKEYVPEIKEIGTPQNKNVVIANLLKSFSGDELERIGVKHGNVNLIYAGDSINLEELGKIIATKKSILFKH